MLAWALIGLGVAAGGAGLAWTRRAARPNGGRADAVDWAPILKNVADRRDGRASGGASSPSLRGSVDGMTVTLTLLDVQRGPERLRAKVEVALPRDPGIRLYIGWDVLAPAQGFDHVPKIDVPLRELTAYVRADDKTKAEAILDAIAIDLLDVRREALANALEVTVRSGYLQLTLHGLQADEAAVDRTLAVTARMSRHIDRQVDHAGGE